MRGPRTGAPTRRAVLRGLGVTLALPWLESLAGPGEPARPGRLVWVYVPNGMHMPDWRVPEPGPLPDELPPTLAVLERHRASLSLLSGLTLDKARANGDGPGDHARAAAAFLTCSQPHKGDGTILHAGVSADQVAARALGTSTRFPSLQLGCESGRQSGQCDSGYSCVYSSNVSWSTPYTPLAHETSPALLFDRLFGLGLAHLSPEERERRLATRRSLLDFVSEDARRLAQRLGRPDRDKLGEYLQGVRELELRVRRAAGPASVDMERPGGIPDDLGEHAGLLYELLALALATDSTRVATFLVANEGSNRTYPELGVREGHHTTSHHGHSPEKQALVAAINRHHLELLGRFLDRLGALEDGDGSLLDRTLVVYGSGIADGNQHGHADLPVLLAGSGPRVRGGEHLTFPSETPLANLHLALLRELGVPAESFGDSTGALDAFAST